MLRADFHELTANANSEHANYDYLTSNGSVVIVNNGIEFSIIYFVMLLALLFIGAGRYVSVDYWVACKFYLGWRVSFIPLLTPVAPY